MLSKSDLHKTLKETIGEKRYSHSLSVANTARELALVYGYNLEKAEIAGLLHDCGRYQDNGLLLKRAGDFDIILDDVMKINVSLIHGPLGAEIAKRIYNIEDSEILDAIRYHTTGRANMTILEKIIYLSDYIEPNRDFPGVEEVRKTAYINLDKALLWAMDNTIKYVIDNNWLLHLDTINARNYLLINNLEKVK